VFLTPTKNGPKVSRVGGGSSTLPQADTWAIIERFAQAIPRCEKKFIHKLAVETIRDSIQAEAVFWYPGNSGEAFEIAGQELPADWCLNFAKKLMEGAPGLDGRLLRSVLPPSAPTAAFSPRSAAMVRVSRSHTNWIVAVNFRQRSLQPSDLSVMALVRRILVNQRRYSNVTARMTDTLAWLVQCLTTSIDAHLPHARGHSERVAKIAVAIGKHMKLPSSVLNDLYFAGLLHDIGITSVPQSLLLKTEKLTVEEYATIQTYPVIGDGILAGIQQLAHLRPAVRHHHERFDGKGYPDRLSGDEIPLMARVLGVADAVDAMRSDRPHRPAMARTQVDDILADGAGKQWDPRVVEHYLVGRRHFQAICEPGGMSPGEPAIQYVVQGWNADSSDKAGGCGPPGRMKEALVT